MKDKLKSFVEENRTDFDLYEPSPALWQRIEARRQEAPVRKMGVPALVKWGMAAAACALLGWWLLARLGSNKTSVSAPEVSRNEKAMPVLNNTGPAKDTGALQTAILPKVSEEPAVTVQKQPSPVAERSAPGAAAEMDKEKLPWGELASYSKDVRRKQALLQQDRHEVPVLYEHFSKDLATLQQQYSQLEQDLKKQRNQRRIMDAMQLNLEMQSTLISRQLEIMNNIKEEKKKQYELLKENS